MVQGRGCTADAGTKCIPEIATTSEGDLNLVAANVLLDTAQCGRVDLCAIQQQLAALGGTFV